ncbi:hypothetical protein CgunFtcFv8_019580 [Champsocephalus gunnari]|uniref:Uncharacterized protein n=1 Tax=Champsocephalus gunnari TaxID=52237 RepID=A0AAN8DGA3_CHAGU|nr:hypothetical protein CgunFtcFv8_019580 [Champsocephalus gunnari]
MRVIILLPVTIVLSVALLGFTKIRKRDHDREEKHSKFQDVKLRVTNEMLQEYQREVTETKDYMEMTTADLKALTEEIETLQSNADEAKNKADICNEEKKMVADQLVSVETLLQNLPAELNTMQTEWTAEVETLKQQLAARSAVCDFLKAGSADASKLCGEEPKAEVPKPEGPKAEAPKPEGPKAEAPKPEGPKAEAPKPEGPKAEAPKPEGPKAEAPKPEEPKAEAPKPEEPKAEAPKPEEPKAVAPKQ